MPLDLGTFIQLFCQPHRGCVLQPKVAPTALPWVTINEPTHSPERVEPASWREHDSRYAATPLGLIVMDSFRRVAAFAATLGFVTQPRCG